MTVRELSEKYGLAEAELYVYACKHLDSFRESAPHERAWDSSEENLRRLENLLEKERALHEARWPCDPADEEPDDTETGLPLFEPDEAEGMSGNLETRLASAADAETDAKEQWKTKTDLMEEENASLKQELASLRHEHLTVQRDAAAKQAALLSQAAQDRKSAEAKISALREDAAAQKHLASVRIKELEERNDAKERQLMDAQEKYNLQAEELMNVQHALQELRDAANKKGTRQALELLDAQGQQEKLSKTIHEKDLEIMEAKEKQQEILEKYNAALGRIGEIIAKVMSARERMKEISAEFDAYIDLESAGTDAAVSPADLPSAQQEPSAAELPRNPRPAPNPETVEILGRPVGKTPSVPETAIREQKASPSLWRRIASLF